MYTLAANTDLQLAWCTSAHVLTVYHIL